MKKRSVALYGVIFFGVMSGCTLLYCENMRQQAEENVIAAHQKEMNCMIKESEKVPSCKRESAFGPNDYDFCSEANAICMQKGLYHAAVAADHVIEVWEWRLRVGRAIASFTVLVFIIGLFGLLKKNWDHPLAFSSQEVEQNTRK